MNNHIEHCIERTEVVQGGHDGIQAEQRAEVIEEETRADGLRV